MSSIKLSLVIPTYNKIERLKLTLLSLNQQSLNPNLWEVILVDDGSEQDVYNMVKSINLNFSLKYVYQENGGRSKARNTGINYSKGDLIVFSDDDLIASPQFLESHYKEHEVSQKLIVHGAIYETEYYKFFSDPLNGIVLPQFKEIDKRIKKLKSKTSLLLLSLENFPEFSKCFQRKSKFEKDVEKELLLPHEEQSISWLGFTGGNVSIKKTWLKQLGGFDENLGKKWGAEDIEFGYRLYQLGFKWIYSRSASNYHISHYRGNFIKIGRDAYNYCQKKHSTKEMQLLWSYLSEKIDIETFNEMCKIK